MSENASPENNAESKPDAKAGKPAAPGPALPLLLGVAGGALVAGAAAGFLLVGPMVAGRRAPAAASAHAAAGEAATGGGKHGEGKGAGGAVFRLDNLIVNPAGSEGTRFIMATVAFEVADEKAVEGLREREIQLRDAVIGVFERETLAELTVPGARDTLRRRIVHAVGPLVSGVTAEKVYLPQFVIQ